MLILKKITEKFPNNSKNERNFYDLFRDLKKNIVILKYIF